MDKKLYLILVLGFIVNSIKNGETVSRCYLCTGNNCNDPFDSFSATITACNKEFQMARSVNVNVDQGTYAEAFANSNANLKSANLVASTESPTVTEDTEVELIGDTHQEEPMARITDIKRKIWEFFYKIGLDDNTSYVCVKASYIESGYNRTYRGCVPENHKNVRPCEVISTALGLSSNNKYITGCYTCTGNLCNSSINLRESILFLGIAMFVRLLL